MKLHTLLGLTLVAIHTVTPTCGATSLVSSPFPPQALSPGATADCHNPGISADGRFVVFVSAADNLVANDSNGDFDVFVRDRQLGKTLLVSVNSAGTQSGNGASHSPAISANGQFVVFESSASDLVTNDNNHAADVFVRDLVAGTTTLVSVDTTGLYQGNLESTAPTITPDGRYVFLSSRASNLAAGDANNAVDLFVRDLVLGTTTLVTRSFSKTTSFAGKSPVWDGNRQISDEGRWVAFHSAATNLVQNDINAKSDVFVRDLQTSSNLVASVNVTGTGLGNGNSQNVSMDGTGRYVVFESASSNLATNDTNTNLDVFRRDLVARITTLVSANTNGTNSSSGNSSGAVLSTQGNVVVFFSTANDLVAGDTNTVGADLFLRDFSSNTTTLIDSRVSVASSLGPLGTPVPALSADGRFVLYLDTLKNLVLFDALQNSRTIISTNTLGADGVMTDDASFVAFIAPSDPTGLQNIYLYDRLAGTTELISQREPSLTMATGSASSHVIPGGVSSNGQFVVLESYAADLSPGDTNRARDVWVCDLNNASSGATRLSAVIPGFSRGPARNSVISGDARWVAFEAIPDSTPLASLSTRFNLYAFDRVAQTNVLVAGVGSAASPSLPRFSQQNSLLTFQSSETGVGGYSTTVGQVYYRDPAQNTNRLVSLNYLGTAPGAVRSFEPAISPDGRYVAYLSGAADLVTNATSGINAFLWDSASGSNILVSASANGAGLNQITRVAFWANGSLLSFQQGTTNYLFDVATKSVVVSLGDTANISLNADGRLVACERGFSYSRADANSTTDVYVIDRSTGLSTLVSVNPDGTAAGNGKSLSPWITPDGRYVLFRSRASNLAANDTNDVSDVFLRDLVLNRTTLLSINRDGSGTGNKFSGNPILSADGSTVLFESYAADLVSGDYNNSRDIMVLRLSHGDSDGDGLPDDWELAYFNTLDRDGTGDFDGDGQTDRMEFLAGTDPTNAGSVLRVITLSSPFSGPVRVFWSAVPGKMYRVQFKDSLSDSIWIDLSGDVLANDTTGFKDDPTADTTGQRYYRVFLVP